MTSERPDPWHVQSPITLGDRVERLCTAVEELVQLLRDERVAAEKAELRELVERHRA